MSSNLTGELQRVITKSEVKERISVKFLNGYFLCKNSPTTIQKKMVVENGGIFNP